LCEEITDTFAFPLLYSYSSLLIAQLIVVSAILLLKNSGHLSGRIRSQSGVLMITETKKGAALKYCLLNLHPVL
jgi:hypothetical protein